MAPLALLAGCGLGGPAYQPPPADAAVVSMGFVNFDPEEITVPAGTTVEWRNTSPVAHTVTADPDRVRDPAHVELPAGAERFDSGRLPAGQVFRHTFTVPGTYRYVCVPHESEGMLGTVIVT